MKEQGGICVPSPTPRAPGCPFIPVTKPAGDFCRGQVRACFQRDARGLLSQLRAAAGLHDEEEEEEEAGEGRGSTWPGLREETPAAAGDAPLLSAPALFQP